MSDDIVYEQTICKHENAEYTETWSEQAENFNSHFYCPDCHLQLEGNPAIEMANEAKV